MNRIFKVIFNHATQSWMAVSELQKAKGKTKSLSLDSNVVRQPFPMLKLSLMTFSLLLAVGNLAKASQSESTEIGNNANASGESATALGSGTTASGYAALAVGRNANASASNSSALGNEANAFGEHAIAFGTNATATTLGIAIGEGANARSYDDSVSSYPYDDELIGSIAIGRLADASDGGVAIGRRSKASYFETVAVGALSSATGQESIAIGRRAQATDFRAMALGVLSRAEETNALAIGSEAKALGLSSLAFGLAAEARGMDSASIGYLAEAGGDFSLAFGDRAIASNDFSIALGYAAQALQDSSVALGSASIASEVIGTNSAAINGITYSNFAGSNPVGTVSIGHGYGQKRTITNVAAGRITATSTDAINGSQLYIIADKLSKDINAAKVKVVGGEGVTVASNSDANGTVYTVTVNTNNTAIKIDTSGNITANTGKITPADDAGKVTAQNEKGAKLATVDNVAEAINSAGWVVNTGKAADQNSFDTAAVNHQPTKISAGSKVTFQAGKNMEVKRDGENNIIYATSDNVSFNTVTVGNTKITNDGVSIVNGPSMTKDGIDAGGHRITNVKPGRPGTTDAVNMQQLRDATININNQLNKMDKRRKAGHASGLAVAGLMQAYREGQSAVTAGLGQYQNQTAVAVGYSRIADSGKYGVKAAFTANTQGEVGGTLSAGYFW